MIWPDKFSQGKLGAAPLHELLARGAFKCRKVERGCNGTPAESVDVSCMEVGMSKTVAKWSRSR